MSELEASHVKSSARHKFSPNSQILIISGPNEKGAKVITVLQTY